MTALVLSPRTTQASTPGHRRLVRHYGLCTLHADAIGIAQGTHSADWAKFIVLGLIDWDLIELYG